MTVFKLPISYVTNTYNVDTNVINDLELLNRESSLYNRVLNPSTEMGRDIINIWASKYSTNTSFLKDTQSLVEQEMPKLKETYDKELVLWKKMTNKDDISNVDTETSNSKTSSNDESSGFHEKYNYVEWTHLRHLNNNAICMQWLSIYNMLSPVLTLVMPIFFLILPFFILKIQGTGISLSNYVELLKLMFQKHQFGKLFTISSASWDQRVYILLSLFFYIMQIYQNIRSCIRFIINMRTIHEQIFTMREYIDHTIGIMNEFDDTCNQYVSYDKFIKDVRENMLILEELKRDLDDVEPIKMSVSKFNNVGNAMKCFYKLYNDSRYQDAIKYSFDFCGYIDLLTGASENISAKYLGKCKFSKKNNRFTEAFYPITHTAPVKNTYDIDKHLLITGPNAAGKTTILKTTLFNILITQQVGYGCYSKASINPFHRINCYINIPDTSNRDSLFQAEARRCKNILDTIDEDETERHFCVFDELYSGTNPYEAISSAVSFLEYVNTYKNVKFIITTHYLDICNKLEDNKDMRNCNMKINSKEDGGFDYTYKLVDGVSDIKGGVKVLKDLAYPERIVSNTQKLMNAMNI
jgi:DNA mismatch repair ATPase MutS